MPLAEEVTHEEATSAEAQALRARVAAMMESTPPFRILDDRPANIMRYQGHLVVIDLGEEKEGIME